MVKYRLVNPHIEGNIKTIFNKKTPNDAAHAVWKTLSKYISNRVPKFAFTLQKEGSNTLYHYLVEEKVTNDVVDYTIHKLNIKNVSKGAKVFRKQLKKHKKVMSGGFVMDDDDDDDDEDVYDIMKSMSAYQTPISLWWYSPQLYRLGNIFIPTFNLPVVPYVYVNVPEVLYY